MNLIAPRKNPPPPVVVSGLKISVMSFTALVASAFLSA